jgi:hypothetical protein
VRTADERPACALPCTRRALVLILLLWATVGIAPGTARRAGALPARYAPAIDAADFAHPVENPWWPLRPGIVRVYTGTKDGMPARDVVTVTTATQRILGVDTVVVRDRLFVAGQLAERTLDYYAADQTGTVWYFGEDTAELDRRGHVVSREGTWRAGRGGAQPGVVMESSPVVGKEVRQEYLRGHAEDWYRVVTITHPARVPQGSYADALATAEWTPLEPGVLDRKEYAPGIGEISERAVRGPKESLVLVEVRGPAGPSS